MEVRRAATRFVTREPGRTTWHSFSFGPHYDPANISFGGLVCHNDDHVSPGFGYDDHPHVDLEIVTWVLDGALTHAHDGGVSGVVGAGEVQVLSAGSGVRHSETVDRGAGPTRFVQTWVRPDRPGTTPSYRHASVALGDGWTEVAGPASLPLGTTGGSLSVARLASGDALHVPALAQGHLFVASGGVAVGGDVLADADAARLTASDELELRCLEPAELMLWSFSRPAS